MSKVVFLSIFLISLVNILHAQNHVTITKFEFATGTRGYKKEIILTKDSIIIHALSYFNSDGYADYKGKISEKEWDSLINAIKYLALPEIPYLAPPAKKRSGDASYGSNITITTSDKERWSHSFDNYHPNEKLQELMVAFQAIERGKH